MAAIGSIRKHGILLMCIIGVALLAFVMGDITQLSALFSDKYTMVKINGKQLDEEYRIRLEQNTALWKIFYEKSNLDETEIYQVHDMTWNQLVEQTIIEEQFKDLGLSFTKEMQSEVAANMLASLQTPQPNQLLYRLVSFIAQQVSIEEAIGFIANIEEYRTESQVRELYNAYKAIERFALIDQQKTRYMALAKNTINFSDEALRYFAASNNTMLAQAATFFPTAAQFNDIQATVTDKEVRDWFNKHKNRYRIRENSRDIDVAIFPIQPSAEDLVAIQDTAVNRAARLRGAASLEDYHISMMYGQLDSIYFKRGDIQIDTLAKLIFDRPVGSFIEPIEHEGMVWYYGKTYGAAKRPDSVHVAYLIVDFKTDRNPNANRTQEEARVTADSLKNLLQRGANIFQMIPEFLGGRRVDDTTFWAAEHTTYPELYNALLTNRIYVQDASGAFVIYQVLEHTTPVEKRQFVIYTEEIKPSDATIKAIRNQAMQLQAESNSAEELMVNAAQKGIQVIQGKNVTSMMSGISQLQNAREIVSWAFSPGTKVDHVSDIYNINNNFFAVAAVRDLRTQGIPRLEGVRDIIETELVAMKKMELIQNTIAEQLNSGSSIQQVAEKYQVGFMDSVRLAFAGESYQNRGIENAAIGKIFTLPIGAPTAVTGRNNLYAVSVYEINEAAAPSANYAMERSMMQNTVAGRGRSEGAILEGLRDNATIIDQRFLYFSR
ncbi:MAG: SurA N-terminal domain-containing protein [Bacteroidetes bacterium]|nr:SurA N-terminal domain-containing protein [Bacteroidota bacterium]MCL2302174.1 SurA N-terminal domain-containing protein [Lentimicrobiaceae bacterium]